MANAPVCLIPLRPSEVVGAIFSPENPSAGPQFVAQAVREKLLRDGPCATKCGPRQDGLPWAAIHALIDFAARKVGSCAIDEQIVLYAALSETLPDMFARKNASLLSRVQSEVSALQLELNDLLAEDKSQAERLAA